MFFLNKECIIDALADREITDSAANVIAIINAPRPRPTSGPPRSCARSREAMVAGKQHTAFVMAHVLAHPFAGVLRAMTDQDGHVFSKEGIAQALTRLVVLSVGQP